MSPLKSLTAAALLSSAAFTVNAATLYSEDFTGQLLQGFTGPVAGGTTFTAPNGQWTVTAAATQGLFDANDHARVENDFVNFPVATIDLAGNEHFQWRDVDEPATWRTTPVDISNATDLNISFDYFEVGNFESTDTF